MTKFVYFDVGGVVLRDFSKTNSWVKLQDEIGITQDQEERFKEFWDKFTDIDTTRDIETLKPLIERGFNIVFPKNYSFLVDGFVNKFQKNQSIWRVIDKIHKDTKVGLLTNMYIGMFDEIERHNLFPNVKWDVVIDSSKVKLRKPDPMIFKLAEEKCGFKGHEILFVENSPGHVKAAADFGWQTFLYDPSDCKKSSNDLLNFYSALQTAI